ncbi:MAG: Kdo hydroxylase family protein [Rubrivivax sp.]|nr:Kdo hydroxylase family protein [Rubrivivax sp.]MDH5338566.1 Kdo hydroxylase family protein [Rubrivivax sp.]
MTEITTVDLTHWDRPASRAEQDTAVDTLERGGVVVLPRLPFALLDGEPGLLSGALSGKSKNISLDPAGDRVRGIDADATEMALLHGLMARYAAATRTLLQGLLPHYTPSLQMARTSFRPAEVAGRPGSWRKDDTRLHVDAFPSSPTHGARILRVFSNVNPNGQARTWRLGEPFEDVARRFLPTLRPPLPGSSQMLHWLHVTRRRRTAYDHYMLGLHDALKADLAYQTAAPQVVLEFEPGWTWIVYTDQASHAALRGRFALEQSWYLPVQGMKRPDRSPLRVLERLTGRALA